MEDCFSKGKVITLEQGLDLKNVYADQMLTFMSRKESYGALRDLLLKM